MNVRPQTLLCIAAILGALAVASGAFGAHAIKGMLSEVGQHQYDLGVRYAFVHILAIFITVLAMPLAGKPELLKLAAWCFVCGVVLFSGSLLLLALSQITVFAVFTPLGGLAFLLGWVSLAYGVRGGNNHEL